VSKAETLRRLDRAPPLLVLPNAWDVAKQMLRVVARIAAAVDLPLTADLEPGTAIHGGRRRRRSQQGQPG
jgi:2-methylisocitrate lyase-like PEP mutase family enzyme